MPAVASDLSRNQLFMSATKLELTHSELQEAAQDQKRSARQQNREQVFDGFRRWGYLQAQLDPLGQYLSAEPIPDLDFDGDDAEEARSYYCGTIAAEFMHIPDRERREWITNRLETEAPSFDRKRILDLLIKADVFEQVIQSRYLGTKRFSLEGVTALIPFLDETLNRASEFGGQKAVMVMSHRGRLSV